ncbi:MULTISPECIES: hypothetical protein [unclassified Streptomyces]|uniref:hypothetical protein n=1 Tax=unclassified Streptomyces TaxID=2593676 RepID=UPI0036659071
MTDNNTYMSQLMKMAEDGAPVPALVLATAEARRRRNLKRLAGDIRFAGINELLTRLSEVGRAFAETPELSKITFMIQRAHADFMTALEATLSGYFAVASDAMRDVLEIEYLLMDFAIHPGHAADWLTTDDKGRMKKFAPVHVRKRLQEAGVVNFGDQAVSMDYKGHSMALHVSPVQLVNSANGIVPEHSWLNEAGFWEIFDHGRALLRALSLLVDRTAPGAPAEAVLNKDFIAFNEASRKADGLKRVWMSVAETAAKGGDPGTVGSRVLRAMVGSDIIDGQALSAVGDDEAVTDALFREMRELAESDEPIARAAARLFLAIANDSVDNDASPEPAEHPSDQ